LKIVFETRRYTTLQSCQLDRLTRNKICEVLLASLTTDFT